MLGIPSKIDMGIDCPRAFVVLNSGLISVSANEEINEQRCKYAKQINDYVNSIIGWEKQLSGGIIILDYIPRLRSTGKVNKSYLRGLKASNELQFYLDQSG